MCACVRGCECDFGRCCVQSKFCETDFVLEGLYRFTHVSPKQSKKGLNDWVNKKESDREQ